MQSCLCVCAFSLATTDSGSNFLKAFRVYGVDDENNNAEPLGAEPDESGECCIILVCEDAMTIVKCLDILKSTLEC